MDKNTLYVSRDIKNTKDIIAWAKSQNIEVTVPEDEMHVTIVFSKKPMEWGLLGEPDSEDLVIPAGGERACHAFGDAGVILFSSFTLTDRNEQARNIGFTWDHPSYKPHITFTYENGSTIIFDAVEPYTGQIILGPEKFEPIKAEYLEESSFIGLFG